MCGPSRRFPERERISCVPFAFSCPRLLVLKEISVVFFFCEASFFHIVNEISRNNIATR